LQRAFWREKLSAIVVLEGWDASGIGGSIRRLTARLEPRGYRIRWTHRPRTYETQMPWLWRFWLRIPAFGKIAIFDRSWYGDVILRRVEGEIDRVTHLEQCREINAFERTLADDRYEVVKFFLHISEEEQEQRFQELQADPAKSWMLEEEHWARHESYGQFHDALEETLEHTESAWAPWTVLAATDRYWTRIRIFERLIDRLERRLEAEGRELPPEEEAS
jgi:polyphosphate kinase 2 (PPK2 family)